MLVSIKHNFFNAFKSSLKVIGRHINLVLADLSLDIAHQLRPRWLNFNRSCNRPNFLENLLSRDALNHV